MTKLDTSENRAKLIYLGIGSNLGNRKSEQLMDVVRMLENNLGKKAEINFKDMQPRDIKESFADIDRAVDMLDYHPSTNVDVGIKKFVDWYINYQNKK